MRKFEILQKTTQLVVYACFSSAYTIHTQVKLSLRYALTSTPEAHF